MIIVNRKQVGATVDNGAAGQSDGRKKKPPKGDFSSLVSANIAAISNTFDIFH
jgi:hypothetical protein